MNAAASRACSGEEMLSRCIPLTDAMSGTQNSSAPTCGFREIHARSIDAYANFASYFQNGKIL
jgi:hypothetical protein